MDEPPRDPARELARMKRVALALLIGAAFAFIVFRRLETDGNWAGYARATAEAAMVGALADWFAVTALFRHPLGIPIPHTAIIPTRKEALGRSLGDFVHGHFLTPDTVAAKVHQAEPSRRLERWLSQSDHQDLLVQRILEWSAAGLEAVDDDAVVRTSHELLLARLDALDAPSTVAAVLDSVLDGGHQRVVYEVVLRSAQDFLAEQRPMLRARLQHESPWYVPEFLDDRVFERLHGGVTRFVAEIAAEPEHEVVLALDAKLAQLAHRLRDDPALRDRVEVLAADLARHPEFARWLAGAWRGLREELGRGVTDPESVLRRRLSSAIAGMAERLRDDPELRATIDNWVVDTARIVTERGGGEVGELIASTVQRWDPTEASTRIEMAVGRDLQFIRINGTLVGGLAGLAIHTVGEVIG